MLTIERTKSGYVGRKEKFEHYRGYTIVLSKIDRDWSEAAWSYKVTGTTIKDECEGYDEAIIYAKGEIDNL